MNPARRVRNVKIWQPNVTSERHPDGTIYLCSGGQLGGYPDKITARLEYWAKHAPDRIFLARRNPSGAWNKLTYAEALSRVRSISEALLQRKLSAERPVLILSGNSIEHALLALSAMYCGILYAPIAPAYSLATKEYDTLRFLWNRLRPGLVFAAEGQKYERALRSVCGGGTEIVVTDSTPESLPATPFEELRVTGATGRVDDAHKRVGPDTIA